MEPPEPIKPVQRPRKPRRRVRTPNPEVRERLLLAAGSLINEGGFGSLRVDEIAERAGLSVGTFYLYFDGKPDLFANLVVELTAKLREKLSRAYREPGDLIERLERAVDAYLNFVDRNRRGFLYFRDAGTVHTTVGPLNTWAFSQYTADLAPLLEDAMERGEVRRDDPELLAHALLGQIQHLAGLWIENEDRFSRDQVKSLLMTLGTRALKP